MGCRVRAGFAGRTGSDRRGTAASLGSAGCGGGFQVSDQNRRTSGGGSAWREWGAGRWACPVPVPIYRASQPGGIEVRPVPASYEVLMVFLKNKILTVVIYPY
jgi:hypothetical protein